LGHRQWESWSDVDWLNCTLRVERGIVHQVIDGVKTPESQRFMHIESEMLDLLKTRRQATEFSAAADWMFASPAQIGRLPFSYAGCGGRFGGQRSGRE